MNASARNYYSACPQCDQILQDKDPKPGELGRCPRCKAVLVYSDELVLQVADERNRSAS